MNLLNLRRAISRRRGQSLVEMAMVLPVLTFLTFGLLDFGRAYYYQVAVTNAAREGARVAILNMYIGPLTPACSSSNSWATCPVQSDAAIRNAVRSELAGTQISAPDSKITICPPHDASMSTTGCPNTSNRVDLWNQGQYSAYYVTVNVKYDFQLYTPILQNLLGNPITMSVSVQMRPNY
jgi:hypothetical protein